MTTELKQPKIYTLSQAIEEIECNYLHYPNEYMIYASIAEEIIEDIFLDFESRTCRDCKHIFNNGLIIECWNNKVCNVGNRLDLEGTNIDFGCNKFERKA